MDSPRATDLAEKASTTAPSPPPPDVKIEISNPIIAAAAAEPKQYAPIKLSSTSATNGSSVPLPVQKQASVKLSAAPVLPSAPSANDTTPSSIEKLASSEMNAVPQVPAAELPTNNTSAQPLAEEKERVEPVVPAPKRVLLIETSGDNGKGASGAMPVFGEDLGSPLPQDGASGGGFWADLTSKPLISPADAKSPTTKRRLLAGYSKDNLLRKGYKHLLLVSVLLFAALCWVGDWLYGPRQTQIEDFLYRMLAFACATCFAAIALHSYFMVVEIRHAEKIASALCASGLAALSMATHLIIGFQGVPLTRNYAGRTVHVVRWVEQIAETFIIIFAIEAVNWRMRRSITSICFQVGAQVALAAGTLQTSIMAGMGLQVGGLVLYAQVLYLWFNTLKRHRANLFKPRKERDQNVKQAWGLVNTFFLSTNGFLAMLILGLLQSYTSVQEAMLYSALDLVTKMLYAAVLVRR